jgi:hypothetical protein
LAKMGFFKIIPAFSSSNSWFLETWTFILSFSIFHL